MDDLTRWQLEDVAQRALEAHEWLKKSAVFDRLSSLELASTAIRNSTIVLPSPELQAAVSSMLSSQIQEPLQGMGKALADYAMCRIDMDAAIGRIVESTAVDAALKYLTESSMSSAVFQLEASYAELGLSLIGLHRKFAGVGTAFTVTLDQEDASEVITHEAGFELSAGEYEVEPKYETEHGKYEIEPRYEADNGRLISDILSQDYQSENVITALAIGDIAIPTQSWSLERSENSQGQHGFTFRGVGGEKMRRTIDILADVTQWIMGNDESAKERVLSSLAYATGGVILPAEAATDNEPIGIRAQRLKVRTSRLERWDRIRLRHIPNGLTRERIAEIETVSPDAIKKDFNHMRRCGLLPPAKSTP